jgi:hypothetical protein
MIYRNILRAVFSANSLLAACLLFLAGGCVPVSGTYYKPSSTVGKPVHYEGGCGPKTRMKISRDGATIWATYSPLERSNNQQWPSTVGISFYVHKNKKLTFNVNRVAVLGPTDKILSYAPELEFFTNGGPGVGIVSHKVNLGATARVLSGNEHLLKAGYSSYYIFMRLKKNSPKVFYLKIPKMHANDKFYPTTTIKFTRTHGHWLAGEAC